MQEAYIVVREERHIDDRFWVCLSKEDAFRIAKDVTEYWCEEYEPDEDEVDENLYEDMLYNYDAEDSFKVYVIPQKILSHGEDDIGKF